jgi:hypothetical protein
MLDRVEMQGGGPVLRAACVAVAEVVSRVESGEALDRVAAGLGLGPIDVIAALAHAALGPEGSEGPTLIQARPPRPALAAAVSDATLGKLLPGSPRPQRLALAAGLLQMLDAWDASHTAAQEADDLGDCSVSPYWHGIAHRREPDAGNASYWFRRAGRHAIFPALAQAARPILDAHGDAAPGDRLIRGGSWDPFAFIDYCTTARAGTPSERLARRLQRLEMALLLGPTTAFLSG